MASARPGDREGTAEARVVPARRLAIMIAVGKIAGWIAMGATRATHVTRETGASRATGVT